MCKRRNFVVGLILIAVVSSVLIQVVSLNDFYNLIDRNARSIIRLSVAVKTLSEYLLGQKNEHLKKISEIQKTLEDLEHKSKLLMDIIFRLDDKVKEYDFNSNLAFANVYIINKTQKCLGSGVYLKYKDKFYVLTAGHIGDFGDEMYILTVDKTEYPVKVIKRNKDVDLMLLDPQDYKQDDYAELSDDEPVIGSNVYLVGNPNGYRMITTNGVVSKRLSFYYIVSAPMFFGNSGGGLYYKNKLVGIASSALSMTKIFYKNVIDIKIENGKLVPGKMKKKIDKIYVEQLNFFIGLKAIKKFLKE